MSGDRDSYCTPKHLTDRLPRVDRDPCSNARSTVRANRTYARDRGEDGLGYSWEDETVFVNGPFSNLAPFVRKIPESRGHMFLCNTDNSTEWWEEITWYSNWIFLFSDRIQFVAPPEVVDSSNDRAQTLFTCNLMRGLIDHNLDGLGTWFKKDAAFQKHGCPICGRVESHSH